MVPYCLVILGFSFLTYDIITGEVTVGFIVFFPFISSTSIFGFLGISCLFLGMITLFFIIPKIYLLNDYQTTDFSDNEMRSSINQSRKKMKSVGIVFLGPIPIIFGLKRTVKLYMILLCAIVLLLLLIYASLLLNK